MHGNDGFMYDMYDIWRVRRSWPHLGAIHGDTDTAFLRRLEKGRALCWSPKSNSTPAKCSTQVLLLGRIGRIIPLRNHLQFDENVRYSLPVVQARRPKTE